MFGFFRISLVLAFFVTAAALCTAAQAEDREFGWSLIVSPGVRKKAETPLSRKDRLPGPAEDGEIRIDTQLVLSDLLVQDKNGDPVSGLKAGDFEITENGTAQNVDVFAYGDSSIPRSIILVIDHSLSQWRHIDLSVAAAKVLVDSLRPTDRMAIVSDDVALVTDFTSEKDILKERLEMLKRKCLEGRFGKSFQYSALFAAVNERIQRNGTRNIVIFQTDGDELATLRSKINWGSSSFGIDNIVSAAERKGVTIYSVFTGSRYGGISKREQMDRMRSELTAQIASFPTSVIRSDPSKPVKISTDYLKARVERLIIEEAAVASVAERSGGIAQSLESPDQAAEVYDRILSDIGRRYLVGYYPPERTEGKSREREVRITLRNKGNHRIVGGRTYVSY